MARELGTDEAELVGGWVEDEDLGEVARDEVQMASLAGAFSPEELVLAMDEGRVDECDFGSRGDLLRGAHCLSPKPPISIRFSTFYKPVFSENERTRAADDGVPYDGKTISITHLIFCKDEGHRREQPEPPPASDADGGCGVRYLLTLAEPSFA